MLQWVTSTGAPNLDPQRVGSAFYNQYLLPVYDRLTRQRPDGTLEPMLATEWEVIEGAEPALEMTLRDDVVFPSGTPFDAEVVKLNVERAKTLPESVLKTDLAPVESVEVLDPHKVRFNLTASLPGLATVLSDRAGMMIDPSKFTDPNLSLLGGGIGQYVIEDHQPNSKIVYVRNDSDYWDPDAQLLAGITMTILPDTDTRLNAVLTGQADALELAENQVEQAEREGLALVEGTIVRTYSLNINNSRGPLAELPVRQALQHAIDREAISESLLYGRCVPSVQWAPEGYLMHNEEIGGDYFAYDPDRARELLAEGGYPDGFAFETIVNNIPIYVSVAEVLQSQFAEIGVDMSIRQVPSTDIVDIHNVRKLSDASVTLGIPVADPSQGARAYWSATGVRNPGGDTTPEIEALIAEVSTETDEDALEEAWNDLTQQIVDFVFRIDICNPTQAFGMNDRVQGLEVYLLGSYDFRNVYMTK